MYKHIANVFVSFEVSHRILPTGDGGLPTLTRWSINQSIISPYVAWLLPGWNRYIMQFYNLH